MAPAAPPRGCRRPHGALPRAAALVVAAAAALTGAHAAVTLPAVFSDGVVLQQRQGSGSRAIVYGRAAPGEVVTLKLAMADEPPQNYTTTAASAGDPDAEPGSWFVTLNPNDADGNGTLTVAGSADGFAAATTIRDVTFGDVFLCSGQSNMVFNVAAAFNASAIAARAYPNIRLFAVAEGGATEPQFDLPPANGTCAWWRQPTPEAHPACNAWHVAGPHVTPAFSATCFLTAIHLHEYFLNTTGKPRNFGLVYAAVGGTAVQEWSPPEALAKCAGAGAAQAAESPADAPVAGPPPVLEGNSTLFNAMIAPLSRFALRGALWYQGEANQDSPPHYYACAFPAMIESWRRRGRLGDYPFAFVQLAAQVSAVPQPDYEWFRIRLEQAAALPRSNGSTDTTGMAVAYDLGDLTSPYGTVHPRLKVEVGRRLALQVLHTAYALQSPAGVNFSGPVPLAAVAAAPADGNDCGGAPPTLRGAAAAAAAPVPVTISFGELGGAPAHLADTHDCWECCDATRNVVQFCATTGDPTLPSVAWVNATVALTADGAGLVATPVTAAAYTHVRYAAATFPQCALYNALDLPSPPFVMPITAAPLPAHCGGGEAPATTTLRQQLHTRREWPLRRYRVAYDADRYWRTWRGAPMPAPVVDADGLLVASTPAMGWNHWNTYHCNIDEQLVRRTGDALVSLGLAGLGYTHVNVDDCALVARQPGNGSIIEDPVRFPSGMRATADYLHAANLSFGVYTAQCSETCQQRPGSFGYEAVDAASYCSWGVDYLKVDHCGGTCHPQLNTSWIAFRAGIAACTGGGGRDILLSVESCSDPSGCGAWIADVADSWRTTGDIQATFASVLANLDGNDRMAPVARPGKFNDADLLQVGSPGLTPTESRTHFSLWALIASPLLISADVVSGLARDTLDVLSNAEVIALNQDALAVQGTRVSPPAPDGAECWAKPLADGAIAAVLLNRGAGPGNATVTCTWDQLGLPASESAAVRDLWAHADLGAFTGEFTASVPPHGCATVRVAPTTWLPGRDGGVE